MNAFGQQRTISCAALRENIRLLQQLVPSHAQLLAVVKADAYGHGAVHIAREAVAAGASWLAVARPEEGALLREAGIAAPILVLGPVEGTDVELAVAHGLTLTVFTPAQIRDAAFAGRQLRLPVAAHLKLDTGMGRIGARTADEVAMALDAAASSGIQLSGAYTHFADADGDENGIAFTRDQFRRFLTLTAPLPAGMLRHCANSAAIHRLMPEMACDMVRMGISMYGYPPVPTPLPLRPVMSWTTVVTHVKEIEPGEAVSYGRTFHAERPTRVATIACGYGDGYHRAASGQAQVLIHGHRAPVIGRICMDQMMADITELPPVSPGDRVTLMGEDGGERIDAEDIARWAGTISYEVLLAATGRVERVWSHGDEALFHPASTTTLTGGGKPDAKSDRT